MSIPLFPFFVGKSAKTRAYPGMNRRKGNPRIVRIVVSFESSERGSKIFAHTIHSIISMGYLVNKIFMVLLYIPAIISILFEISIKKIKKNTKIEMCNRFLRWIGRDSDMNSFMISNPIVIRIKMASKLISVIVVIKNTIIVHAIIHNIIIESVKRLVVFSPVFRKMIKNPINIIVILIFMETGLGIQRRKTPRAINIIPTL